MKKVIEQKKECAIIEFNGIRYPINVKNTGIDRTGHGRTSLQITLDEFAKAVKVDTLITGYPGNEIANTYFYDKNDNVLFGITGNDILI